MTYSIKIEVSDTCDLIESSSYDQTNGYQSVQLDIDKDIYTYSSTSRLALKQFFLTEYCQGDIEEYEDEYECLIETN